MPPYPNLISESLLVSATLDYLAAVGGSAPAVKVVDHVMRIRKPEPGLARLLVSDIVERDRRLAMIDDVVEVVLPDHESIELEQASFVVFDLETTGAKAPPCRITEIGAFRIENGRVSESFNTLVNPETPIPEFITGLTGISNAMVANAPTFSEIADGLLRFIGDSVLVAHNARFDMSFLNHEVGRLFENYSVGNPSLCTVNLSRRLLPDIENHKLKTVAAYYSIDLVNHHRAGDDAYATAQIFLNLLSGLSELGIKDLGEAKRFSNKKYERKQVC